MRGRGRAGQLVDIGGRRINQHSPGGARGGPTVILMDHLYNGLSCGTKPCPVANGLTGLSGMNRVCKVAAGGFPWARDTIELFTSF